MKRMRNSSRLSCFLYVFFLLFVLPHVSEAAVEWKVLNTLQTGSSPIATRISPDGRTLFVLTEERKILIYSTDGKLEDSLQLNESIDGFEVAPTGDRLFLTNGKHKSVQIVSLDFIRDINTAGSPFKGREEAPVVITVFSDFQCPYCAKIEPVLEQALKNNPNDVKVVFKNFPLTRIHKFAMNAALSAMAAGEQGKFWEFHDKLFAVGRSLNDQKIEEIVGRIGLDKEQFDKDKKAEKIKNAVAQDMKDAATAKVRGTPAVFVNGRLMKNRNQASIQSAIENALAAIRKNVK